VSYPARPARPAIWWNSRARDVDPDAEGVGAADHTEQAALGQGLDQPPVPRQHPGVVDRDPGVEQLGEGLAEPAGEPEAAHRLDELAAVRPVGQPGTQQRLGPLDCGGLGGVDDVDRRLGVAQQQFDGLLDWARGPVVLQRNRTDGAADHAGGAPGAPGERACEVADITERRRHDDELRLRQLNEGHLPGPPTVGVGDEVELVHHHLVDPGRPSLAEGEVRQDLRCAAHDRRVRVHCRIAGDHPDPCGAEDLAQGEELLAHERLYGSGVVTAAAGGEAREVGGGRDQGLAGAGRRGDDRVGPGQDVDDGLVLVGIQFEPVGGRPVENGGVQRVRIGRAGVGDQVVEPHRRPSSHPRPEQTNPGR